MKIEKITIYNIASIAGEQTIDFTDEPLRSAALFSITGNTGAGKSTILDAICLALYNRAPRLEGVETMRSEDLKLAGEKAQQVQAKSTATLLRRGQREGSAAVVFSTLSGERYEAVWSVRVKRTGTYESPERSLRRLAPTKQRYNRTEVQSAIEQAIGLSYEQFTRTVILAQNSFANFLQAKTSEKAVLLEKLTGTEIYGTISKNIYNLTQQAQTRVRDMQNQMAGMLHDKLDEQELAETNERRTLLNATLTEATQREATITKQVEWTNAFDNASRQVAECETNLAQATRQLMETRADELSLARYDELLPLRPAFQEIVMRRTDLEILKRDEEQNEKETAAVRHNLEVAGIRLDNAREHTAEAEQQRLQQAPAISRGHTLTGEISVATQQLKRIEEQLGECQRTLEKRSEALSAKKEAQQRIAADIDRHRQHKQALSVHRLMFEKFDLIKDKLSLLLAESRRNAESHKRQAELQKNQQELEKQGEKAEQEQHTHQARLNTLKSELLIHRQTNQGRDSAQLQQAAAQGSARLDALRRAAVLWQHICDGYKAISEKQAALRREKTELSQLKLDEQKLQAAANAAEEAYEHISTAYTLSQSQNIVRLRQQLKEGTACPVCGATHHPYHTETERELGELLTNLSKQYGELQQDLGDKREKLAATKENIAAKQAHIDSTLLSLTESEERQRADKEEWKMYACLDDSFAECSPTTNRDARRMMIELLIDNTTRRATEAKRELEDYNFHQQHINRLNEEIDALDTIMVDNRTFLDKLHTEAHIAAAAATDLQQTINLSDRACSELYTDLDEMVTLSGWFTEWKNNPDGLRLRLTNLHSDWLTTCKALDETERQAELLTEEIKGAVTTRDEASRTLAQTRDTRDAARGSLHEKQNELQCLFGNSTPQEESEKLDRAVASARAAETLAQRAMQQGQANLNQLEGQRENLKRNREDNHRRLRAIQQELDLKMLRFNGSHSPVQMDELKKLFADTRDWNALRRHINTLKEQRLLAENALDTARRGLLKLQAATYRPEATGEEARQKLSQDLTQCRAKIKEVQEELALASSRLLAHKKCVERAALMQQKLDRAQADATEWERLNTLFGSADGQKFRKLAQSYTFTKLVSYANHHLRQLSPRYELRNLPGTLTLEIIDRDMFDERRYVPSLSGGETFVVSLALALGLASLSGHGLSIGSLFIDEGFGNLDRDSLDLVMQALSNLENQQGRKVGVISHTEQIRSQISPQILVKKQPCGGSVITIR